MVPIIPIPKKYTEYQAAPLSLPIAAVAAPEWESELTVLGEFLM